MEYDWLDVGRFDTFPKALKHNFERYPREVAMREKDFGVWNEYTWTDYYDRVKTLALGLRSLKVRKDHVVALIGDNRPEWVFGELAAHSLRALSLGIYRDALDDEVSYLINYARAKVIFAEDEEQVDKLLSLNEPIPSVERIIYSDRRGMRKYDDPRLITTEELVRRGEEIAAGEPNLYDELVSAGKAEDAAILCTTSGTTSHPKLAVLQAGPFMAHAVTYLNVDPMGPDDEYVSVLPLPWIMEQVYSLARSFICRWKVNFVEEPETMLHDMREIGPTCILLAPRMWEAIAAEVRSRTMDASRLKQKMFELGARVGLSALERGQRSRVADLLLYRALRDRLGFSRLRSAATGGAALGPETFKFFLAMGVPLRQLYGQTELMGAYTIHSPEDVDFDTVGVPFEGCEVRIDKPDSEGVGEIVTRNPNMFAGYYKNEEATRADVHDGWMYTGDAGYFNRSQHLVVIDRLKDLSTTVTGIRFSPQYIENKLKFSPYIGEAVILGAGRAWLAAIICIRFSIVSKWAEKNRIAFTTYTDLAARREVYDLIQKEMDAVNAALPQGQRIRRFLLLYKELDADDGELTRTRKVRRGVVTERYGTIIDAIYSDRAAVDIDTTIAFQDGSKQRIRTTLRVVDLEATLAPAGRQQAA